MVFYFGSVGCCMVVECGLCKQCYWIRLNLLVSVLYFCTCVCTKVSSLLLVSDRGNRLCCSCRVVKLLWVSIWSN